MQIYKHLILSCLYLSQMSACATFKTLDARLPLYEKMFIYSGTRLDWAAINQQHAALSKYKVAPPNYPIFDLPFSFTLDTVFLPMTLTTEIFH